MNFFAFITVNSNCSIYIFVQIVSDLVADFHWIFTMTKKKELLEYCCFNLTVWYAAGVTFSNWMEIVAKFVRCQRINYEFYVFFISLLFFIVVNDPLRRVWYLCWISKEWNHGIIIITITILCNADQVIKLKTETHHVSHTRALLTGSEAHWRTLIFRID